MKYESIKKRLWKEMGVERWYLRPEKFTQNEIPEKSPKFPAALADDKRSPKINSVIEEEKIDTDQSTHEPFRFQYLNSDAAVWVFVEEPSIENRLALQDVVLSFNLLKGLTGTKKGVSSKKIGVFEWPLVDESEDPAKALSIFFEKYRSEGKEVFVCKKAFGKIHSFFEKGSCLLIEIPDLSDLVSSELAKKSMWDILKSI